MEKARRKSPTDGWQTKILTECARYARETCERHVAEMHEKIR